MLGRAAHHTSLDDEEWSRSGSCTQSGHKLIVCGKIDSLGRCAYCVIVPSAADAFFSPSVEEARYTLTAD